MYRVRPQVFSLHLFDRFLNDVIRFFLLVERSAGKNRGILIEFFDSIQNFAIYTRLEWLCVRVMFEGEHISQTLK
jgi:hypothetical protein